ncbi:MAG TPA: hypothetical protein VFS52_19625 [Steroidobacteraceae bacterium]|jgi:hypothetical protein|nr:hypothetical protein [Steroidobacteraceae bacterium]
MRRAGWWLRGVTASICLAVAWSATAEVAADSCDREASWTASQTTRHFLVLAASQDVFYDGSGPSFVMLMKTDAAADESEMGAVGVYADAKRRAVFGAIPPQAYDAFLREPKKGSPSVMLRLEISGPQYERILGILRQWDRRAREGQLLYRDDVFMDNILLVKQATEALNRCRRAVDLYKLDWGTEDRISDEHARSQVPFLVFEEMKRRNASLHVPDDKMPAGLIRPRS